MFRLNIIILMVLVASVKLPADGNNNNTVKLTKSNGEIYYSYDSGKSWGKKQSINNMRLTLKDNTLKISFDKNLDGIIKINIVNILGSTVFQKSDLINSQVYLIELSCLKQERGIFFITVSSGTFKTTGSFIMLN